MKKILAALLLSLLIFSGCTAKDENKIIISNGDFGEMYIFSHMAEILIKEYTDHEVEVTDFMSTSLGQSEIKARRMHVRLSYDGTMYKCLNKSTQKCAYKNPHLPRKTDSFLIQSSS